MLLSRRLKVLLFAVVLGLLYNDWLLGPFVNARMSVRYSVISELSAHLQPYAWLFRTVDISTGIVTLLVLPGLWRFLQKVHSPWRQVLFATIACIGADSIIDAMLPISCAPSMDSACNLAQTHSFLTNAHMVESTIIGIITFVAPLLWARVYKTRHAALATTSWWCAMLQFAMGLGIVLTRVVHHDEVVGTFQRFYQLGIGAWVAYVLYTAIISRYAGKAKPAPSPALAFAED